MYDCIERLDLRKRRKLSGKTSETMSVEGDCNSERNSRQSRGTGEISQRETRSQKEERDKLSEKTM